jgi:hypothetical protein
MLCRLALALVCGLALAAPSLADNTLPNPAPPKPRQADWKLLSAGPMASPVRANRIVYARVPAQAHALKPSLPYATGALRQDFSHTGLLVIFLKESRPDLTIGGVYPTEDGALTVELRNPPPPPPFICPLPTPCGPLPSPSIPPPVPLQYIVIAVRKGSLPTPVTRLYISEAS